MATNKKIVLDIETVPGPPMDIVFGGKYFTALPKLATTIEKAQENPSPEMLEKIAGLNDEVCKAASLDFMFGRIVCIGTMTPKSKTILEKAFSDLEDEAGLLKRFWEFIVEENVPQKTITFNGIEFDLPYLYFRSMINGIEIPWGNLSLRRYSYTPHFDVMQAVVFWGFRKWKSLNVVAKLFGYKGDCEYDGSWVSKWAATGQQNLIEEYCLEDCRRTLFVYNQLKQYFPAFSGKKRTSGKGASSVY